MTVHVHLEHDNIFYQEVSLAGKIADYHEFVHATAKKFSTQTEDLLHAVVGMSGEAGEALDAVKKAWIYEKPLDKQNLIEELGDSFWYMTHAMNVLGVSLVDVIDANKAKLKRRYASGAYSNSEAQARNDKVFGGDNA